MPLNSGTLESVRAPKNIAHADWGTDPRKRQIAVAELIDDHSYRVTSLRAADALAVDKGDLWGCAHLGGPTSGQLLIGFDFPIGVPAAYARLAGIDFFPDLLAQIGIPPWDSFADVAATPADISLRRPFYPARPGGTQRIHLSTALGLAPFEMRRRCDGRDAETMFWTLGGKQVGKAALAGWKCLSSAPPGSWRLWPFEGTLDELLDPADGIVVVETYPREFYRHVKPATSSGTPWSKRRQADRNLRIPSLMSWASRLGVTWAPAILERVEAGFSAAANGEDEFDAAVGLLGMIAVATGWLPSGEPTDDADVLRLEGWMLGRPS